MKEVLPAIEELFNRMTLPRFHGSSALFVERPVGDTGVRHLGRRL